MVSAVKHNSETAQVLDEDKLRRSGSPCFFADRPALKQHVKNSPAKEIEHSANREKRNIQIVVELVRAVVRRELRSFAGSCGTVAQG